MTSPRCHTCRHYAPDLTLGLTLCSLPGTPAERCTKTVVAVTDTCPDYTPRATETPLFPRQASPLAQLSTRQ